MKYTAFEFVERVADEVGVTITTKHIQHILGTLRFAGFAQRLAESELATARKMIQRELRSVLARSPYVRKTEASTKESRSHASMRSSKW